MFLSSLTIRNFRNIQEVDVDFTTPVSVIVGPNAVGKTTVLEAIRLAKALLSPRTQAEGTQVLTALGATAPQIPNQIKLQAICGDMTKQTYIRTKYTLSDADMSTAERLIPNMAMSFVQSRLGQAFAQQGPVAMVQFLSSEQGRSELAKAEKEITAGFVGLKTTKTCTLAVTFNPLTNQINGEDLFGNMLFASLDSHLPPSQSIFSYFPADRAMPSGDVHVQLGANDVGPQMESHNSQAASKYSRLKNTIVTNMLQGAERQKELDEEFERIFSSILKGRRIKFTGLNEIGLVAIQVEDTATGRVFDLDGMSSGEKGLILTFLLIGRSVAQGGVVLLDEPELHLNPAVCRSILPFILEKYCKRKQVQAIICSHSPEVLSTAFDNEECALYHMRSGSEITKVRQKDREEVSEALRRIGTSEVEGMLYRGTVFVEGEHDAEVLIAGFGDALGRYMVKDLGGRKEVEKQIEVLQQLEKEGKVETRRFFIFDLDTAPTTLASSNQIKILQWKRRCLENHLIDVDVIFDLLHSDDIASKPVQSRGEMLVTLKDLAIAQLTDIIAQEVYELTPYENAGFRPKESRGKDFTAVSKLMFERLHTVQTQLSGLEEHSWTNDFVTKCQSTYTDREQRWKDNWMENCDGKRLFADLHKKVPMKISLLRFKSRVAAEMRNQKTELWRSTDSLLKDLLQVAG